MKTILLLDDDDNIRSTFGLALRHSGYRVIEASSGEEGLRLAAKHLPDLILSDISMPGKGGEDVLKSIREHPELSSKQVVLMTGQTHIVTPRRGMELGADDFLTKPISLQELLHCVEARLKRAQVHWRVEDRMLSRLRSTLHSSLPHELFTPLAGVVGLAEILKTNLTAMSLDEVGELIADIHASAVTLHRTLRNYLLILELEAIPDNAEPAVEFMSAEVVNDTLLAGIQTAIRRNKRDNDIQLKLDVCPIVGKSNDFSVIVEELVDNACKFSKKGTPLQLHFGQDAVLIVQDSGRGMTAEEISQVGSFRQFDRKKFEQQGLGLGLSLVQKLTARCGAGVVIKSQPGVETTIEVAFQKPVVK
jgi:two-component system sensor histidine kinase/response regulator